MDFSQIKSMWKLKNCSKQPMECYVPVILNSCKNYPSKSVNILLGQPVLCPTMTPWNEALCGKIDFELQAKVWAKVNFFFFFDNLPKYSSSSHGQVKSWQTLIFSKQMWGKMMFMEHSWLACRRTQSLTAQIYVKLFWMMFNSYFITFYRNITK